MPENHTFIRCRRCSNEVFYRAKSCPNCRHPLHGSWCLWFVTAIITMLLTMLLAHWMSDVEKPPVPQEVDLRSNSVAGTGAVLLP